MGHARRIDKPDKADNPELVLRKENKLSSVGGFFDLRPHGYEEKHSDRDYLIHLYDDQIHFSKNLILHKKEQHRVSPKTDFMIKDICRFEVIESTSLEKSYFLIETDMKINGNTLHFYSNPFTNDETKELEEKLSQLLDHQSPPK